MKTAEDLLNEKGYRMVSVSPKATVQEAVEIMVENKLGAILVMDGGKCVGIWTERDLLRQIIEPGFDHKSAIIGNHMVTELKSAQYNENMYQLFDKLVGLNIRHLLIEKDGDYIGIISERDVTRLALIDKRDDYEKLNEVVNFDYYEDWKWKKDNK